MISLIVPWTCLLLLVLCAICLYKRRWNIAFCLFVLLFLLNWYGRVFSVGSILSCAKSDVGKTLTVLSFNVNGKDSIDGKAVQLARIVLLENADIVFLAEDFDGVRDDLDSLLKKHYPYTTIQDDKQGHYFYSLHPIDTTYRINVVKAHLSRLYPALFDVCGRKLKVYGIHLASNNYTESLEYFSPDSIERTSQINDYFENVKRASDFRCVEIDSLIADYERGICPTLIVGDFNDVCASPVVRRLESVGMKDAWWAGGFGYGATIFHPLPYRIDHVMYNDGLELLSMKKISANGLSDHDAIFARFKIE